MYVVICPFFLANPSVPVSANAGTWYVIVLILDNFGMSSFKPRDIKTISKLIWEELLSVKSDRSSISIKASNIYDSSKIAKNTIAYYESTLTNG